MNLSVVNFIKKYWWKSINNRFVYKIAGFSCIYATLFRQYTQFFLKHFTGATESGVSVGCCNFRNLPPISEPKRQRETSCFWHKTSMLSQNFTIWSADINSALRTLMKPSTLSFNKNTISAKTVTIRVSRGTQKIDNYLANEICDLSLSLFCRNPVPIFGGIEFGVMVRIKVLNKPGLTYDIVCIHSLMIYTDLIE